MGCRVSFSGQRIHRLIEVCPLKHPCPGGPVKTNSLLPRNRLIAPAAILALTLLRASAWAVTPVPMVSNPSYTENFFDTGSAPWADGFAGPSTPNPPHATAFGGNAVG